MKRFSRGLKIIDEPGAKLSSVFWVVLRLHNDFIYFNDLLLIALAKELISTCLLASIRIIDCNTVGGILLELY